MKKSFLFVVISLFVFFSSQAQTKEDIKEVKIKTYFHCGNGKAMIEKELVKEKGVKEVKADLETKIVTVKYDAAITDKDKINAAIENIGYQTELTPKDKQINKACSHDKPKE